MIISMIAPLLLDHLILDLFQECFAAPIKWFHRSAGGLLRGVSDRPRPRCLVFPAPQLGDQEVVRDYAASARAYSSSIAVTKFRPA
jgi:hypothetical protein